MTYIKNYSLEDIEGEEWKDVVGFENLYQVSNLGRIKSLNKLVNTKWDKKRLVKERIMKQNGNPYLLVFLGWNKIFTVHSLVAKAHIPNPQCKPTVNHKNGDKKDNRASELEWCTRSEQMAHARKLGLIV